VEWCTAEQVKVEQVKRSWVKRSEVWSSKAGKEKSVQEKIYSWGSGHISVDPNRAGPVLEGVIGDGGAAEEVLQHAEKRSSPLHDAFEWDDAVAAHEHRLEVARLMLRSLRVTVRVTGCEPVVSRVFVSIRSNPAESRYLPAAVVMRSEVLRDELRAQLKSELRRFASRNAEFRGDAEMAEVFAAIDCLAG